MYELHRDIDSNLSLYCNIRHLLCDPKSSLSGLEQGQLGISTSSFRHTKRIFKSLDFDTRSSSLSTSEFPIDTESFEWFTLDHRNIGRRASEVYRLDTRRQLDLCFQPRWIQPGAVEKAEKVTNKT